MTIYSSFSRCQICRESLYDGRDEPSIFYLPDSGMQNDFMLAGTVFSGFGACGIHQGCFKSWEKPLEFVKYWNEYLEGTENFESMALAISKEGVLEFKNGKNTS